MGKDYGQDYKQKTMGAALFRWNEGSLYDNMKDAYNWRELVRTILLIIVHSPSNDWLHGSTLPLSVSTQAEPQSGDYTIFRGGIVVVG